MNDLMHLQTIFRTCWEYDILRVLVFIPDNDDLVGYTYDPFIYNSCRNYFPYFIGVLKWNNLDTFKKMVFGRNVLNFQSCPIYVSINSFPPFTMFTTNFVVPDRYATQNYIRNATNVWGIEGEILKLLAEYHNFTVEVLPVSNEPNEMLNEVLTHKSDIAVGGLNHNDFWGRNWSQQFSISNTYYQTYLVIIIRRRMDLSSFYRFVRPFSNNLWILISIFSFIFIFLYNIVKYFTENLTKPFKYLEPFTYLEIFFGYTARFRTKGNFPRFMVTCLLLISLVMRTAYQGTMFNAIRMNNQLHFPRTKEEMLAKGFQFYYDGYEYDSVFYDRMEVLTTSWKKLAFMMTIERLSYYNMGNMRGRDMVLIPKSYVSYRFGMVYRRRSFLLRAFNTRIHEIDGIGFYSMLYNFFSDEKYTYYDPKSDVSPIITAWNLFAVFKIHAILLSFAFSVLLGEILYFRCSYPLYIYLE